VRIAETSLQDAGVEQRSGTGEVEQVTHRVGRTFRAPGHRAHHVLLLLHRQGVAGQQGRVRFLERLHRERARRVDGQLSLAELVLERATVGEASVESPSLGVRVGGQFVHEPLAHTHGEAQVLPRHVCLIAGLEHRPTSTWCFHRIEDHGIGDEHVVHVNGEAAGALQRHHVPVVVDPGLARAHDDDTNPWLLGAGLDGREQCEVRVLHTTGVLPGSRDADAAIDRKERARGRRHRRHDGSGVVAEHDVETLATQTCPGHGRRTGVIEPGPGRGGVRVRQRREVAELIRQVKMISAHLQRRLDHGHPQLTHQRVQRVRGGSLSFGLGRGDVELDVVLADLVHQSADGAGMMHQKTPS